MLSSGLNKICKWFLISCFTVMTITYFSQIVFRYVFQMGLHWSEELTRYTNIALVMLGSAMIAGKNSHINVSILEMTVPIKVKKWLIILQQTISAIFFVAVIKISFDMIKFAGTQVSTNLRIPMAMVYGIFPVAFTILVFQVIVFILNSIMEMEVE